ncbi:hypothetical protein AB0K12_20905 [Nonomuraea sp. NPDC049419]|uniref:hypothetical protein n=1 Tax=Nonomuraea sp. NPDC049419 TaxID=3155772 RepID=UPI00342A8DF2
MDASAEVRVSDHAFGLLDDGDLPIGTADHSNGLIIVMSAGALLYTGIDTGTVHVTLTLAEPPGDIDPSWEDVVEASVHAPRGRLRLDSPDNGPVPAVPLLSAAGPGWYRVLACVRGRDRHFDAVHDDPGEAYHLWVWPAPPAPAALIRTTDRCGAALRATPARRPPRQESGQEAGQEAGRRTGDRLDEAIRRATGRPLKG